MADIELVVNGERRAFAAPLDVRGLLERLGVNPQAVAVELNGEVVPRLGLAGRALANGDVLEIVRMVGGG